MSVRCPESLHLDVQAVEPSNWLKESLLRAKNIPIRSEKARSEFIISPILVELKTNNQDFIELHSGDRLDADKKSGLVGECDFIVSRNAGSLTINSPILTILEAKRQDIE